MSTRYSIGAGNQLCDSLEEADYTADDVTKLRSSVETLRQVKDVLCGFARIVPVEHIVDLDADPFLPEEWQGVEEHKKGGKVKLERRGEDLYINDRKVELFLSERQIGGRVQGHSLREEVSKKEVLNANVLDYLLVHPELIPESWKGKWVFFWGTIYRGPGASLGVRCLDWAGARWNWNYYWVVDGFSDCIPAAVLASG